MPRKTRMYLPGVPAHIVQRGNNREACFFAEEDYQFYKEVLAEGLNRYGAKLHAYCLMTNNKRGRRDLTLITFIFFEAFSLLFNQQELDTRCASPL